MRFSNVWLCLWPGLPWIWLQGQPRGFVAAGLFALMLNLALVATFVWPEWFQHLTRSTLWIGLLGFWVVSVRNSHRYMKSRRKLPLSRADSRATLDLAVRHYLGQRWLEAEMSLKQLLAVEHSQETGVFTRLTLASLYRRTNRRDEAVEQLGILAELPGIGKWESEIRRERERLVD